MINTKEHTLIPIPTSSCNFTRAQKNIIRLVVKMQLESLEDILSTASATDVLLFESDEELPMGSIYPQTMQSKAGFERVYKNPNKLFTLVPDDVDMVKHILLGGYIEGPGYEKKAFRILRKINSIENIRDTFSAN